jgi:hypothetical protein
LHKRWIDGLWDFTANGFTAPSSKLRGRADKLGKTRRCFAFTRELEKLRPDHHHVRDNPANDTGQKSANSFKSGAMPDYWFIPAVAKGDCRDPQLSTFNLQPFCGV